MLEIFTFGGFSARREGKAITGFRSRKVTALLAYLAVHPQPQPRETLAELLWEDRSQSQAFSNLRVVLSDLRKHLGEALAVTRDRVGLVRNAELWIDTAALDACLDGPNPEKGIEIYQGDFLQGFYAPDAAKFDVWTAIEREKYHQRIVMALQELIAVNRQRGQYQPAVRFAQRLVELDRLSEVGHFETARLLALTGQHSEALGCCARYRQLCQEELGVELSPAMGALVSQLQSGQPIPAREQEDRRGAAFAVTHRSLHKSASSAFVGRVGELTELHAQLRLALQGEGRFVFLCGETGSGKSALLAEFARQAIDQNHVLLAVTGSCTVFSGMGDPFLPFRDLMAQLTGGGEKALQAGILSEEQARRLREWKEITLQAILQHGPDLVGSMIPARQIRNAAGEQEGDPYRELVVRAERNAAQHNTTPLFSGSLLDQYADVLTAAARRHPLLILLDDLQWADPSTVSLLSHLSRHIQTAPILVVGAYRPADDADRQLPFRQAVLEFKRQPGSRLIDLDQLSESGAQDFMNALIDTQPNQLSPEFRRRFVRQTGGNPFFAVELLREIQERGLLRQDAHGRWIESGEMDWDILPTRVEAVIELRTARLNPRMFAVLQVASLTGDEFSAEIIGLVLGMNPLELVQRMNAGLVARSRLITELGVTRLGEFRLSQYRFTHGLFQRYFYESMGSAERMYLHERAAVIVEETYQRQPEELASASSRLAWHFQEAGQAEKAVDYWLMAGSRAAHFGASEDAVQYFQRGIDLLPQLANRGSRQTKELSLRLAMCAPLQSLRGYTHPEVRGAYQQVKALVAQTKEKMGLLPTLYWLRTFHHTREDRQTAFDLAEEILQPGQAPGEACLTAVAHWTAGSELTYRGEFQPARRHLEAAINTYDEQRDGWLVNFYGNDPTTAARGQLAWVLWFLGFPEEAHTYSREALARAEQSHNPLVRGFAIGRAGVMFHQITGNVQEAQKWNAASREFSKETHSQLFLPAEVISAGWLQTQTGQVEAGLEQMRQGLRAWRASGAVMHLPHYLALYAAGLLKAGQVESGLLAVEEGLSAASQNNEWYFAAELHRLQGELLHQKGAVRQAESALRTAIQIAQKQAARALELRAQVSLANCRR